MEDKQLNIDNINQQCLEFPTCSLTAFNSNYQGRYGLSDTDPIILIEMASTGRIIRT